MFCRTLNHDAGSVPQTVLAVKQLEAAEDHNSSQYDNPKFGGKDKCTDRADSYNKQDQTEQFNLSRLSAAYFFKSHSDHILITINEPESWQRKNTYVWSAAAEAGAMC